MITFPDDVKKAVCEGQNGFCANENCYENIHSYHHKLNNSEHHRKKFPLFIHSPFNCIGLCYECHKNFSHKFRITDILAQEYEKWLQKLKGEVK